MRYSFVADHFQYLANLGVITLIAACVANISESWSISGRLSMALSLGLLALLTTLTWSHARVYTNLKRFSRSILTQDPESWAGHDFLGLVLMSRGKTTEAVEHFSIAVHHNPRYALGHYNLGVALAAQRKFPEATHEYQQAIELQPSLLRAHYNLGNVFAAQGNFHGAVEQYQEALRIRPDSIDAPDIQNNWGIALASTGNLDESVVHFQEAVRLRPDFADAQANLGRALAAQNRISEAIEQYEQALESATHNGQSNLIAQIQGQLKALEANR